MAETQVSDHEDRKTEIIKSEQKEKQTGGKWPEFQEPAGGANDLMFLSSESERGEIKRRNKVMQKKIYMKK